MLAGEFFSAFSWYKIVRHYYSEMSFLIAVNSYCKTILSKYIPGKVWSIVSPVTYISKYFTLNFSSLCGISILHQIIALWTGIIFGIVSFTKVFSNQEFTIVYFSSLLVLSILIIFPRFTIGLPLKVYCRITKTDISNYNQLLQEKSNGLKKLIIWYCLIWFFYTSGFYFLVASVHESAFPFTSVFSFTSATIIGIISIFTMGGLGIREGALTFFLIRYGFTLEQAVTISSLSRLWFLTGETIVFSTSFALSALIRKQIRQL
jgi:hypothetical protein